MNAIKSNYRGLSLLIDLNWDRAIYLGALILALAAGACLGSA
ncbi:hypothetical protein SAMN04488040_0760 [Sulfitobacter marinus]|uniref:Uncharacterized protein n=1 Tax=Sulfitobacter marinus TaxID=394264 RepID=A0A1I6QJK3_9RHOB|nr:hypothetical protein [Sulfitobacter marinus]SFS52572.1 hypothetical protein SAMN04488040_0760 [Sulfitobacter marinus]